MKKIQFWLLLSLPVSLFILFAGGKHSGNTPEGLAIQEEYVLEMVS
jgi:hypothetical protein